MAFARQASTFLLCRFLLGSFEGGFFPGIIYYTSLWYRRRDQALRLGFFWSFSALAGASSGLIAYGISQIKSPYLAEWQLIFIVRLDSFLFKVSITLNLARRYSNHSSGICLLVLFTWFSWTSTISQWERKSTANCSFIRRRRCIT